MMFGNTLLEQGMVKTFFGLSGMTTRIHYSCLMILLIIGISACQTAGTPTPDSPPSITLVNPTIPNPSPTALPSQTVTPASQPEPALIPSSTTIPVTTLLFTGNIVPARCVQAKIDEVGEADYIYAEVREIISQADIAVGVFNGTMSDFPSHTGCVPTYVLVSSPQNADALQRAGFDIMNVATNHIKDCGRTDCGDRAFFDTLDNLKRVGIISVGAGKNEQEALQPAVMTVNGVRFGFVALSQLEQGGVFATEEKAGVAQLNSENIAFAIDAAKQLADVVIFMPHWGPEEVSAPNWLQRNLAHEIVKAGADAVVGNHTHVVQGVQEIAGIPVYYGLGNFVFDQWQRDHQQAVILKLMFRGSTYIGYEYIPTRVEKNGTVHIAEAEEAAEILERIEIASEGLH
ncbi:MAG: CapA family protein [Anaerolineales bacterium]|nr:CapA family protein [Anaerolineales bacterium]